MKIFSGTFSEEILRKNKLPATILSLLIMIAASFSIVLCEKKIAALENRWRSLYELDELWGDAGHKATAESQSRGPTRYDIKASLARLVGRIEIRFCDKYSFIWFENQRPSGVYYKTGQSPGRYVSTVNYPRAPRREKNTGQKLEYLRLHLKCDLTEKKALIYINGKFTEKIQLGPEAVSYSFGLAMQRGRKNIMLNKLEISDHEGKSLFRADFDSWFLYKRISQGLLSLGVLIFLVLTCSEKPFLKRALLFVFLLCFLEVFLRMAYSHHPDLDIHQLKPKWRFEISTNFYGAFDDPRELTIRSYFGHQNTYSIANPEHATRILCIGSSPVEGGDLPVDRFFPAILERKLNERNEKKNTVIPIAVPMVENFNGVEPNIFLKEVLSRLNPDLLMYYGKLAPTKNEYFKEQLEKDSVLYHRAKRIMEKNSDWIKYDRLLYAALEFKKPIKEIVYLYDFLCNSYLFMAVENFRKRIYREWRFGDSGTSAEKPESFFEEALTLCKEKGIKVVFIPQIDFSTRSNDKQTEEFLINFRGKHPETYYLSLENIFDGNKNFLLAGDRSHPNEYGHKVVAQEIFRQLTEKGLLNIHEAIE